MKLSKTQIRLLTIMRDEDTTVHVIRGLGSHAFISSQVSESPRWLRIKTVFILNRLGMIEHITNDWRGSEYRITQAGLDAINGK